ncbi:MAG: family 16 glycoside hydrolase [Anaerolineae bacterium]
MGVFLGAAGIALWLIVPGNVLGTSQAISPSLPEATPLSSPVTVHKTVNVPFVAPGQSPAPYYTVTFNNPNPVNAILRAITDTLPVGFDYIGLYPSSDWKEEPVDSIEPVIVWAGPITIPASSTLTLKYSVYVPPSVPPSRTPYTNTLEAVMGDGTALEPALAQLLVGTASLNVAKEASPTRVLSGGLVTYTIEFTNHGQLVGTVEQITDTLDPSLTFVAMTLGSDVADDPQFVDGSLVWPGPFQVPPEETLKLQYKARTSSDPGWSWPRNQVEADVGETTITTETVIEVGPEKGYSYLPAVFKQFSYARLTVSKSANPTKVTTEPGQEVIYTVIVQNEGDTTGFLRTVDDTLPPGFTFLGMAPGSDVTTPPSGATDQITWTGNWTMPPGHQIKFAYRVAPTQTEGQYTNRVSITAHQASVPQQPASATVTVERGILLEDHFEDGIDRWTPFLNYWRLEPGQWYWGSRDGVNGSGAAVHNCKISDKVAHDALLMYLGEGAEQWTDYRVEVKLKLTGGVDDEGNFVLEGGYPVGLWVRGQYEPSDIRAQWVTGYYVVVGGKPSSATHFVRLTQLQTTTDCWGAACDNPQNLYNFNNSHELTEVKLDGTFNRTDWYTLVVEVRGNRIKAWFNGQLAFDYVDAKEPFLTGTVGLKTYKSKNAMFDDLIVTPLN